MSTGSDSSITLGRVVGVPIRVSAGAFLIATVIAVQLFAQFSEETSSVAAIALAAATALAFLGSILAHELGHTVVAQRAGLTVKEIRLWFLGGLAALDAPAPSAQAEMAIAAAGPATSAAIGGAALGASAIVGGTPGAALAWLGAINLVLAVFNLLPGLPLDGGRVLTGLLWKRRGSRLAAVRTTANVGRFLGQLAIGVGFLQLFAFGSGAGLMTVFIGFILIQGAKSEIAHEELLGSIAGQLVADVQSPPLPTVADHNNAAAARALLPAPGAMPPGQHFGVVVDDAGVARGLLNLIDLHRAADADGTQDVLTLAKPLNENNVALVTERLDDALRRGVAAPFAVINRAWQPVGFVSTPAVFSVRPIAGSAAG